MESKIKKLLGSITYGVKIESLKSLKSLDDIYVKVQLYDRRIVIYESIIDKFETLIDVITDFWELEAKLDVYPRKMATWLSEYLVSIGYPGFNYERVLREIEKNVEENKLEKQVRNLLGKTDPDIKPKIKILDIKIPEENVEAYLSEKIEEFVQPVPKKLKSIIMFIETDGTVTSMKNEQEIIESLESGKSNEFKTIVTFNNPLDIPIQNVQINIVVPYGYKVLNHQVVGLTDVKSTKKLLDDGLQLIWTIPELQSKQETRIEINLERRISRTILLKIEEGVNVINTFLNINASENIYAASDSFENIQNAGIDNLIFEDEIPSMFNLIEAKPNEDPFSVNIEREGFDQLIKWEYNSIESGKKIKHIYLLIDNIFSILSNYVIRSEQNNVMLKLYRIIKPSLMYRELIISYYLEINKYIPEIQIKEFIPDSLNVSFKYPQNIERSLKVSKDKIIQTWKIYPEIFTNKIKFGYICSGNVNKYDFLIELNIPDSNLKISKLISTDSQKIYLFYPQLHEYLQNFKKVKIEETF